MKDKVSVIVPVYNVAPYLTRCLDSILSQTDQNIEVLLIDDGSTDGSGEICDRFGARDARVRVFHQENRGVSAARNLGLDQCTGDYVAFVDSDDWIEAEMFREMVQAMEDSGADLAVCGEINVFQNENGSKMVTPDHWPSVKQTTKLDIARYYRQIFSVSGLMCNKIYRSAIIGDCRFDTGKSYGEDILFQLEVLKKAESAVLLPKPFYYYNLMREGNVVSAKLGEKSLEWLRNTELIYHELYARGYPEVGIMRAVIAVTKVAQKLPDNCFNDPACREYLDACKKLAGCPSLRDMAMFLKSADISVKHKCSFLLMRTNFRLWLLIKKQKKT